MKEHAEKFLNAAKRLKFGVFVMAPADYLLEVIELKRKKGQRMLTEDDTAKMKAALDERSPSISISAETFMGEEILRSWLETGAGDEEARRYCLVNGLIPYNDENLKGIHLYIDARHIPKTVKDKLLTIAENRGEGEYIEEEELREIKVMKAEIEGAWISDGKPIDFKVRVRRHVAVATYYNYGVE